MPLLPCCMMTALETQAKAVLNLFCHRSTCVHLALVGRRVHGHEIVESAATSYASIRTDVQRPIQHSFKKTSHHGPGNIIALACGTEVSSLSCGNPHVMNPVGCVCWHDPASSNQPACFLFLQIEVWTLRRQGVRQRYRAFDAQA